MRLYDIYDLSEHYRLEIFEKDNRGCNDYSRPVFFLTEYSAQRYIEQTLQTGRYYCRYNCMWLPYRYEVREMEWTRRVEYEAWDRVPLIWHCEPFWYERNISHFQTYYSGPHVCEHDPSLISFYDCEEHAKAGRLTHMKPGKYLKKLFPALSEREITYYSEWWAKGQRPYKDLGLTLKFAMDKMTIAGVYAIGPDSCMKGKQAVQIYAAGDLAIAYLQNAHGDVIARALCWPEKLGFGRVYPSAEENYDAYSNLFKALTDQGYTHISKDGTILNGARLSMRMNKVYGYYEMPFLDNGLVAVGFDDGYFRLQNEIIPGQSWSGTTEGIVVGLTEAHLQRNIVQLHPTSVAA